MLSVHCPENESVFPLLTGLLPEAVRRAMAPGAGSHVPRTESVAHFARECHTSLRCREHRIMAHIYFSKPDLIVFGFCVAAFFLLKGRASKSKDSEEFLGGYYIFSFTWPPPFVQTISNPTLLPLLCAMRFLSCLSFRLWAVPLKFIPESTGC